MANPTLGLTAVEHDGDVLLGPKAFAEPVAELRSIPANHDEPVPRPLSEGVRATVHGAWNGPCDGARVPPMQPRPITHLAVVIVLSRQGGRRLCGRRFRETRPEHVPVPREAEDPNVAHPD